MRVLVGLCVSVVLCVAASGCRTKPAATQPVKAAARKPSDPQKQKPIVTPSRELTGKIAKVNMHGRFVVIVFPVGQLPRLEQRLNVYRDGLKVGELKVTGPQMDDTVVADLTAGEAQEGDAVREL